MNPKTVFENFDNYLSNFMVAVDSEIENQIFDRKEVGVPTTGNVSRREIKVIREHIKETISGFANSNPEGGLLVLGISKLGELVGLNHLTDAQKKDIASINHLLCNQSAKVRLHDCQDGERNTKALMLIYVPETTDAICEAIDVSATAWKRAGPQNLVMTQRDKDQIRRDKGIELFERRLDGPFVESAVDSALLEEIRNTWPELVDVDRSNADLLYEIGAVEEDNGGQVRFTNAGQLFFGANPRRVFAGAHIRILRYEENMGNESLGSATLDKTFTGSLTSQLLSVREFLKESGLIRVYNIRRPDGGFEEKPELPHIAIDEAIVNAVAHRDYALEWGIECIYYKDAFVVKSPGRLLQRNGRVPESFTLDQRSLGSLPKNPMLLGWLKQSKDQKGEQFVRALSEGTKAMLRAMTEAGLHPPEYRVSDTETIVTLRIDTSVQDAPQESATEFANLFEIRSSGPLPDDWRRLALSTLADRLRAKNWFIDRLSYGRLIAHVRGNEYPIPPNVRRTVRIYPAYILTFREFQKRRYLVVDYTVEVKNLLTLAELLKRGQNPEHLTGKWSTARTEEGWQNARIDSISDSASRVSIRDLDRAETIRNDSIIPNLRGEEIRKGLVPTGFDLSSEIKRRSLASKSGAARQRAEKTQITAQLLAADMFPIRVAGSEVSLSESPVRLSSSSNLRPRTLAEPLVEFGRHRETSNIREGITEFGSYSQDEYEIEIVPVVLESKREAMEALIERLRTGKFKYKGGERTFGARFSYSSIIGVQNAEDITKTCDRLLNEHPDWIGNPNLSRLFLVHTPEGDYSFDDENSPYYKVKRLLLQSGIPCQMVDTPTLHNPDWKDLNLALNVATKCGIVPWVLPEGFPDADFFVGLSHTQHRGRAESRFLGYANVFNRYGRWLFYSGNAEAFPYEERTPRIAELVRSTLERLEDLPETPHVYFHYTAKFSKDDRNAFVESARRVRPKGTYSFVSINSHHPVRLYDERPETDGSLARGTYVVTASNQVYLSTTGYNPYRKTLGTPTPLELTIWTHPPIGTQRSTPDLHALARQILALTKLNWASSDALTGEPITTKYAGGIAYLTAAFLRLGDGFKLHPVLERTPWFL